MYTARPVTISTARRNAWPFAGICCLGVLGLMIAGTIVLALIPIYLPTRSITVKHNGNNNNAGSGSSQIQQFYLVYSVTGSTISTGTLQNLLRLQQILNQAFGLNSVLLVIAGQSQSRFVRRRRRHGLILDRQKRSIVSEVLIQCVPQLPSSCSNSTCIDQLNTQVQNAARSVLTLLDVPLNISSRQYGITTFTVTLTFVELSLTRPPGFNGEPSTLGQFVASQSGQFIDQSTWAEGIIPYGDCIIIISTGVVVTLEVTLLDLNVTNFQIFGTLVLGSSANATFTFQYPTAIEVFSGGGLEDQTSTNRIYVSNSTVLFIYPNGSFTGSNSVLSSYTSLPAVDSVVQTLSLGSAISGPRTVGILLNGTILTFEKITFLAVNSGNFTHKDTWLGEKVPSASTGTEVNGCGVYISAGTTLATIDLDNLLNIIIDYIIIADSGIFQLQTSGNTQGFVFNYPINLRVLPGGKIEDRTAEHKVYFPLASLITILPNAYFLGNATEILAYTGTSVTLNVTDNFKLNSNASRLLTIYVYYDGNIYDYDVLRFLLIQSGDILSDAIWYGDLAPDSSICQLAGGCFIYFSNSWTLSTQSLNNQLNIDIRLIEVDNGCELDLGTTDLQTGFTFNYPVTIRVLPGGKAVDQTALKKVYFLPGSLVMLLADGALFSEGTELFSYIAGSATSNVTDNITVTSDLFGPLTLYIYYDGYFYNSNEIEFLVVQSGDIATDDIWYGGADPGAHLCELADGCYIYFSNSWTLSTQSLDNQLDINIRFIDVGNGCVLDLGTTDLQTGFTFDYPVTIRVLPGGKTVDQTALKKVYFLPGSLVMLLPNGSFTGNNTEIFSYVAGSATSNVTDNVTIVSEVFGPLTMYIYYDGYIYYSFDIEFLVVQSGDLATDATWYGGAAPTTYVCKVANGCDIYFSNSWTLSTGSFNNELNIDIRLIDLGEGSVLDLGTPGLTDQFTFIYPITIAVFAGGKIVVETGVHDLYLLPDSVILLSPGASFIGENIVLLSYKALPVGENVVENVTIGSNVQGPFTVLVSDEGLIFTGPYIIYIVKKSGEVTSDNTWIGSLSPSPYLCSATDGCYIFIPTGFTLTTELLDNELDIYFKYIIISAGSELQLGTPNLLEPFIFDYPVNLIALPDAIINDTTATNKFYLLTESIITLYPQARFLTKNTSFFSYSSAPAIENDLYRITIDSSISGPETLAVLSDGQFFSRAEVAFLVSQSGNASSDDTWIGALAPKPYLCDLANGCYVYILSGNTLSLYTLDGDLNLNLRLIEVSNGSVLELGTNDGSGRFVFVYPVTLRVLPDGVIKNITILEEIYLRAGSLIMLLSNDALLAVNIKLISYIDLPASDNGIVSFPISDFSGSLTLLIYYDGYIYFYGGVFFIVDQSGDVTSDATWYGNATPAPYICAFANGCTVLVDSDLILSTANLYNTLDSYFRYIYVEDGGVLELGRFDLNESFTFLYPVTLIAFPGSTVVDETKLHQFDLSAGSLLQFFPNATLAGDDTSISSFIPGNEMTIDTLELGTDTIGPLTVLIDKNGKIRHAAVVLYYVTESGDISSDDTWQGGLAPNTYFCRLADGCPIVIPQNVTLSTESLQGVLGINVNLILIDTNAVLTLGAKDDTRSFRFDYSTYIICEGRLEDLNGVHTNISVPGNSGIDVYPKGSFVTSKHTTLYPYDAATNQDFGTSLALKTNIEGPYKILVSRNGRITVSK